MYNAKDIDNLYLEGDETIYTAFSSLGWNKAKPSLSVDGIEYVLKAKTSIDKFKNMKYKYASDQGNTVIVEDDKV